MSHIYKLEFEKSSLSLNDDYERLSDIDKEKINDLNSEASFDFENDDDKYVCYIISKPTEMKIYLGILDDNYINYEIKDMSDNFLFGKIEIENEFKSRNVYDSARYLNFIDDLNLWIRNNLDMDIVLDRISQVGMNKLRDVEKEFLNNYNK